MGCVLDESGTDGEECNRKVTSGRRVAYAIRSLVDTMDLQFECARVLPVLLYGSETILWKEKDISRVRAV